jgi:hypothetical protein
MVERPLACEAWQPALAGWVVAQLDPSDEAALLQHLEGCATCRAEAESLLDVAAVSLGADLSPSGQAGASPPPDLGARILVRVARERRARWAGRAVTAMAAAAGAVIAVIASGILDREGPAPLEGEAVVFEQRAPGVEASGVLAADGQGSLIVLSASGLDPALPYTLWFTPPDGGYAERQAVTTFRPDGAGNADVDVRSAVPLADVGRVWVTTPDGGVALDTARD